MQHNLLRYLAALAAVAVTFCTNLAFSQGFSDGPASGLQSNNPWTGNSPRGYSIDNSGGLTELTGFSADDFAMADVAWAATPGQAGDAPAGATRPWSAFGSTLSDCGLSASSRFGDACAQCEDCTTHGLVGLVGYDSWRGITDDSWQNNGIHTGFNYGTRLGKFSELTGIGFQVGGTIGIYDWFGTDYRPANQNKAETQGFVTYGLFRKANENCRWSGAVVQDWMINNNYGVFSQSPTLSQLRIQVGYAVNAWNEIGIWGAVRTTDATRNVSGIGPTSWQAVNQLNPYWHYKWGPGGADTLIWVGVPDSNLSGGSLGNFDVGALANVPLGDSVGLYSLVTYMHPSASAGPAGSTEEAWNFSIGLSFYPQHNARTGTVAGQCWMPQLPVANNGYFMVDTNHH